MLVLNANQEQKDIFNRLIQVMGAQVVWNGHFVVMGDRLILEGVVRSLIFHFDIQKVEMELLDLDYDEDADVGVEISGYPELQDLITMAIYAFEKWGELQWVSVRQDAAQLNHTFGEILHRYGMDVVFAEDNIRFSRTGMRITYEDVMDTALAFERNARKHPDPDNKWRGIRLPMPVVGQYQKGAGISAKGQPEAGAVSGNPSASGTNPEEGRAVSGTKSASGDLSASGTQAAAGDRTIPDSGDSESTQKASDASGQPRDEKAVAERMEKYQARIGVLDRLSDFQKKALHRDIRNDRLLNEKEKEALLYLVDDFEFRQRMQAIDKEFTDSKNQNYAYIQKAIKKVKREEISENIKTAVLKKLHALGIQYGTEEVRQIMEQVPKHVERDEYQKLMNRLAPYEEIDFSPYREMLRQMRETLEIKEISNMLVQSPKETRADYITLLRQIGERDFAVENAAPYIERILDWVREIDENSLHKLLENVQAMDFDTAAAVYARIKRESFLPQLREQAAAVLSKHLTNLRLAECRMLTNRLRQDLTGVIKENPRHHLYPVEQIMQNTADPEEIKIIETALSSYAEERELFEYPIIVVDTSRECSGRDGMLLTRKHLFYSTRLNGYKIRISAIKSIQTSSGLLNRRLTLEETNGARHKLPYAAEANEMQEWAAVLEKLVRYLQEKPESGVLEELTQELQDAVCCSRCGCVYHDQDVCPECGFSVFY